METNIIKLRANERTLALAIAGLSFILGFLLFIMVPDVPNTGIGDLSFFKLKITLTNVGPGIFFALFGAVVIIYSITTQAKIKETTTSSDGKVENKQYRYLQTFVKDDQGVENLRGGYQSDFRIFATIFEKIEKNEIILESQKLDFERSLASTKETLMQSVWTEKWGDYYEFKQWIAKGCLEPIPSDIIDAANFFLGK